jgi:hypothetical protein
MWGRTAVPLDTAYRHLGPAAAARAATEQLAGPERDLLTAFADGVNAAFAQKHCSRPSPDAPSTQQWVQDSLMHTG